MWLMYEINRGKRGKRLKPADFLPGWWESTRRRPTWQEVKAKAVIANQALGGIDKRPPEKR